MKKIVFLCIVYIFTFGACSNKSEEDDAYNTNDMNVDTDDSDTPNTDEGTLKILSLGDSYTIGQSVCVTCRFPEQLKDSLAKSLSESNFSLDIIAQTGWTTTDLISAINSDNPSNDYDLVTLLIGVNNQFQHKQFSLYENEFPILVDKAIAVAKGDKTNVIVVSIPDYAYTTFGQSRPDPQTISEEIDQYNTFAQNYCDQNGINYINITDITREGLNNPNLVASDGLHPSELAYSKFVERLRPVAIEKIQ